ncbi:hypothetical protein H702_02375 [Streptococcus equinus JB1]|uniref:CAAX prenyl protease 2/Lysostaphin resistance protein A-like domain-containing protein n=1 Tax=Streptococcus equinus JB1 TaxID=1294274 RepID=A0A091CBI8_STREI|nr:type II CAAX endopeptidase family protein [Streptococcus equinus]KFN88658.1 hypothetical protein H702_02375 [Streptococcus equinus JB1]SFL29862.1 hypothetical protein SAMN02910290_01294 [Streptococcus equinus JB1]
MLNHLLDDYREKRVLLLAFPLIFYVIFFYLLPGLLRQVFIKYATDDFHKLIFLCSYFTFVFLLMVVYLNKREGKSFFKVSFKRHYIEVIILLSLVNIILSAVLAYYLPLPMNQKLLNASRIASSRIVLLVKFFWGGVIALLNEELFYRGILMSTYFYNSRYYLEVLVSTFCFASAHVIWADWSWLDFIQYIPAGLSLGVTFRWTKSIYYPILLHGLVNYLPKLILVLSS